MKLDAYSFVFRGNLAKSALESAPCLKTYSNAAALEKEIAHKLPYSQLEERHVQNARRMAAVFVAISAFENMMRDFIERIMKDAIGENWWAEKAPANLRKKVDTRIAKEQKVPWHTPRGKKELNYTDFGDLADLIVSQWDHFEQDVQDQGRIKSIFNIIELSRNACMHGGDLSDRDIERVGMLMRDWIEQLGLG